MIGFEFYLVGVIAGAVIKAPRTPRKRHPARRKGKPIHPFLRSNK